MKESSLHADLVDHLTVFNIDGNKYRLIVGVHLNRGKVFVRHILTHAQYDLGQWKGKRSPPKGQAKKKAPKRKDKPG